MNSITSDVLLDRYIKDSLLIIDVRSKDEFKIKHIPNTYNIPYDFLIQSCLKYLNFDKIYYIICDNGNLSKNACNFLNSKGFKTINITDGISSWRGPVTNNS